MVPAEDLVRQMDQRLALHDFTGALAVAEALARSSPADPRVRAVRERCRDTLESMHAAKLGDTRGVPRVLVPADEVVWLGLDHRAGFVLSQIDGVSSYDEILDVCGMERLDGLRVLVDLCEAGVIGTRT